MTETKTASTREQQVNVRLTPEQAAWLDARVAFGGRAVVLRDVLDRAMHADGRGRDCDDDHASALLPGVGRASDAVQRPSQGESVGGKRRGDDSGHSDRGRNRPPTRAGDPGAGGAPLVAVG